MTRQPWERADTPEEEAARREALQRLADAARRVGVPLEHLRALLGQVARNEAETRCFLAAEVYGVDDEWLDELVRVRLGDLAREAGDGAGER